MYYFLFIVIFALIIAVIVLSARTSKIAQNKFERYIEDRQKEIKNACQHQVKAEQEKIRELDAKLAHLQALEEERETHLRKSLSETQSRLDEQTKLLLDKQAAEIDGAYQKKTFEEQKKFEDKVTELEQLIANEMLNLGATKEKCANEKAKIQAELDDFAKQQEAVNQEILRRKEIEEHESFYCINVSETDREDIQSLEAIKPRLHNQEAFNKLIYDVFIKRPLDEMIKRVLKGSAPAGIYKITYRPTGEFYLGRSTNIKNRWNEHAKTTFGLKGCAHSTLHTFMAEKGIWNFSFEVIEECEKSKLSEREKFYIDLYGAQQLLNMKSGG